MTKKPTREIMTPNILESTLSKNSEQTQKDDGIVRSRLGNGDRSNSLRTTFDSTKLSNSTEDCVAEADKSQKPFKPEIRWPDLFAQIFIHVGSLYGLYYLIALKAKFNTYIWCKFHFCLCLS